MDSDRHVVTVVIPTLGRGSLARCLEALTHHSRLPDEVLQIIDQDCRGAVRRPSASAFFEGSPAVERSTSVLARPAW